MADTRVLEHTVNDLLASATMMAGTATRDVVDLSEIAAAVCDSAAAHAASIGVDIVFASEKGVECRGHRVGVRAAEGTDFANRQRARPRTRRGHDRRACAPTRRPGQRDVADDGVGIDPETASTLFSRFSRGADHTGTARRQPYGIGLALVREIAQAHEGDITVTSTPGRGATFALTLPAAPAG